MEEYFLIALHKHKSIHDTDNSIKYYELYKKNKKDN